MSNGHDRLSVYVRDDTAVYFARLGVRYRRGDDSHGECGPTAEDCVQHPIWR